MPRRKPDGKTVIVHRYELGDFERRQLEDAKLAFAVRSVAPVVGAGIVGVGLVAGAYLVNKNLDDLQEWFADNKQTMFGLGASQSEIEAMATSQVADIPADSIPNFDLAGLSASAVYDLVYRARDDVRMWMFSDWCERNAVSETGANYKYFRENATSILGSFVYADTVLRDGNSVSMFAYQVSIRETAARRGQGRVTSGLVGWLVPGAYGAGALASEAVWWLGNTFGIGQANEWSSSNPRDAPGYIADPLLDWARTIVDFSGPDAGTFGTMTNPETGRQVNIASLAYVEFIMASYEMTSEAEPDSNLLTTLRGFCPPAPQ